MEREIISANESEAKLDAEKNRFSLVLLGFSRALKAIVEVGELSKYYTERGFIEVPNGAEKYTDAMLYHLLEEGQRKYFNPDTRLLHAAHTAWYALARLELILIDQKIKSSGRK